MSSNSQHKNIIIAVMGLVAVVVAVALIGYLTLGKEKEIIQGEMEVTEYRVSSKLPGRVARICVKEGDMVHAGDTLAILEVPEVNAHQKAAEATSLPHISMATALSRQAFPHRNL